MAWEAGMATVSKLLMTSSPKEDRYCCRGPSRQEKRLCSPAVATLHSPPVLAAGPRDAKRTHLCT